MSGSKSPDHRGMPQAYRRYIGRKVAILADCPVMLVKSDRVAED